MKKLITALLLLSMLITAAACSSSGDALSDTTAADTAESVLTETETTLPDKPDLPEKNYDGYEFRFLHKLNTKATVIDDFANEGKVTGEPINDAMYERAVKMEEEYGVTLKMVESSDTAADVRKYVSAGDDAFDVAMPLTHKAVGLAQEGLLIELTDLEYLDVTGPYWDNGMYDDLSINGKLYFSTGDISIMDEQTCLCILYNKKLAETHGFDDIYKTVLGGGLTFDKVIELSKAVTRDLNGDGTLDHLDVFGLGTDQSMTVNYFGCAGGLIAGHDADGGLTVELGSEKNLAIIEKTIEFLNRKDAIKWATETPEGWAGLTTMFADTRLLFRQYNLYGLKTMRAVENDFSIVPFPKYTEDDEYCNMLEVDECWSFCIPVTVSDLERAEIVLEALAFYSSDLIEAYYDITLLDKSVRDEGSKEVLELILNSKCYDIGDVCGWANVAVQMRNCAKANTSFVTEYAKLESQLLAGRDTTMAFFNE